MRMPICKQCGTIMESRHADRHLEWMMFGDDVGFYVYITYRCPRCGEAVVTRDRYLHDPDGEAALSIEEYEHEISEIHHRKYN